MAAGKRGDSLEVFDGDALRCPECHGEVRSLHLEWRGFQFSQAICPLCANKFAQTAIGKEKS